MNLLYLSLAPHMGLADPSGYGTHMREVARALAEAGHAVVRYVAGSGGLVPDAAAVDGAGAPRAPLRLAAHLPPRVRHLARDIRELLSDRLAAGTLARRVASAGCEGIY